MVSHITSDMLLISTYDISFHSFYSQLYYLPDTIFLAVLGPVVEIQAPGASGALHLLISVREHASLDIYRAGNFPSFMPLENVTIPLRLRPSFPTMP